MQEYVLIWLNYLTIDRRVVNASGRLMPWVVSPALINFAADAWLISVNVGSPLFDHNLLLYDRAATSEHPDPVVLS